MRFNEISLSENFVKCEKFCGSGFSKITNIIDDEQCVQSENRLENYKKWPKRNFHVDRIFERYIHTNAYKFWHQRFSLSIFMSMFKYGKNVMPELKHVHNVNVSLGYPIHINATY